MTEFIIGVIQVIDKLMEIPKPIRRIFLSARLILDSILEETPSAKIFNSLYKDESFPFSYSLFLPDDSSFDVLHPVELSYLKTQHGSQDRTNLVMRHACKSVLYRKNLLKGGNVSSFEGEKFQYKRDSDDVIIDNSNVTQPDIVAQNGNPFKVGLM